MKLKEIIENNVVVWLLGSLTTGFLAGISAYHFGLEVFGMETMSTIEKNRLIAAASNGTRPIPQETPLEFAGTHWFVDVDSDNPNANMDLVLLPNGKALFFAVPQVVGSESWNYDGNNLVIKTQRGGAEYRGTLRDQATIIGDARSQSGGSWTWTARKYP